MEERRVCYRCKRELPISEFSSPPSGFRYSCKRCDTESAREYRRAHPEFAKRYNKEYARKNPRRKWSHACLAGHRRRGYTVELTAKQLFELAAKSDVCFICQVRLDWRLGNKGRMNAISPSLGRLNNENVIRLDNVAILCYRCNATKRERTLKEFIEYCGAVATRFHSHLE